MAPALDDLSMVQSSTLFRQLSLILPWQEASAFIGQCGSQVFCGKNGTGSKESRQGVPRIGSSPIFATTYLAQIQAGEGVNGRKPYRNCALSSCEGVSFYFLQPFTGKHSFCKINIRRTFTQMQLISSCPLLGTTLPL